MKVKQKVLGYKGATNKKLLCLKVSAWNIEFHFYDYQLTQI